MKKLMLGNEAVARGLYEAGCSFVSSYPGTPSTEITEAAAKYDEIYAEWAPNEKVALESAFGAESFDAGSSGGTALYSLRLVLSESTPLGDQGSAGVADSRRNIGAGEKIAAALFSS